MNFSKAIDSVLKQNKLYRFTMVILGLVCVAQSVFCIKLLSKEALVVERSGAALEVLTKVEGKRSKPEIEDFLRKSLKSRFNTLEDTHLKYLNADEQRFKALEQEELSRKGIEQEILLRNIIFQKGGGFVIKAERIIRHEKAKAILDMSLSVGLKVVERTVKNPYGLILDQLKNLKPKKDEKS